MAEEEKLEQESTTSTKSPVDEQEKLPVKSPPPDENTPQRNEVKRVRAH